MADLWEYRGPGGWLALLKMISRNSLGLLHPPARRLGPSLGGGRALRPLRAGAPLTLLLLPGLVADGWPQVDLAALGDRAVAAAHHHAQAGLLEDAGVVVVGVAHGPAAQVALRVPVVGAVDVLLVGIGPLLEPVCLFHVLMKTQSRLLQFRLEVTTGQKVAWRPALLGIVSLAKTQLDLTTQRGSGRAQPGCGHVTAGSIPPLPPGPEWLVMQPSA